MNLNEVKLFPPLRDWLKAQGYKVYCEVSNPVAGTCLIDIVGVKDRKTIAIEMKMCLSHTVITQAYRSTMVADKSYCAVSSNPKLSGIGECNKYGVGILRVQNNSVEIILEAPQTNSRIYDKYSLIERRDFSQMKEGDEAGRPNEKGVGSTYDLCDTITEYQKTHPKAGWKEIYKAIPNNYSSHKSMASALYKWRGFTLR